VSLWQACARITQEDESRFQRLILAINFWALLQVKNETRRWRDKYSISYPLSLAVVYFIFLVSFVLVSSPETLVWLARCLA
jgi:hypothetical protein